MNKSSNNSCDHAVYNPDCYREQFSEFWKRIFLALAYNITIPCKKCGILLYPPMRTISIMGVLDALFFEICIFCQYLSERFFSRFGFVSVIVLALLLCISLSFRALLLSVMLLKARWGPAVEQFNGLTYEDIVKKSYKKSLGNTIFYMVIFHIIAAIIAFFLRPYPLNYRHY